MAILDIDPTDRFEAASNAALRSLGVTLYSGTDFEEYKELVREARPDHNVGDPFDYKQHDLTNGKAMWTIGRDQDGQIMHTQALRLLPTGRKSAAEYFRSHFHDFSPSQFDIDFEYSRYRPGPGAWRASGQVVYSGETWVGGKPGQYRGTGLSNILGRCAMLTSLRFFDADYVVGFMTQPVAYKGFCLRMGFMHAEPLALRWYVKGNPTPMEGVMVYMSSEDIRFLLDLPNSEIDALAA